MRYGGETRQIEYLTFTCLWYHAGFTPVTLRIVLVKTPGGENEAEAFFCTDTTLQPTQIIRYFVLRWNIEVTFEETRAHLVPGQLRAAIGSNDWDKIWKTAVMNAIIAQ